MNAKSLWIVCLVCLCLLIPACNLSSLLQNTPSPTPTLQAFDTITPSLTSTVTPSLSPSVTPTLQINASLTQVPTTTFTPTPSHGSVQGILWHDTCAYTGGEGGQAVVLGQGCVQWGSGGGEFGPNQIYDSFESGWSGVTLHIGTGACPSTGFGTAVTNGAGSYGFYVLPAGTYCISYSPLTDGNDSILIPGGATFPERGETGLSRTVTIGAGENKTGVNFGYAWQFYN
jgi:hypothetical protein